MKTRMLFIKSLVIIAVAAITVSLSSCDDDDNGGGGIAEPEIAKGEGKLELSGDKAITIANDGPITVLEVDGATTIRWTNNNGNTVEIGIKLVGETGTYMPANPNVVSGEYPQGSKGAMTVNLGGQEFWRSKADTGNELVKGAINITTNNDSTIAGTISNMKLVPEQGNGSVTVNGEFNASKSNSDPFDSIGRGEAKAYLIGDFAASINNTTITERDPRVSEQEVQGQESTLIYFRYNDPKDDVVIILPSKDETGTFGINTNNDDRFVSVYFDGDRWFSKNGEINISTNNKGRIAGTLNDVRLVLQDKSGSIMLNGGFNLAKD